jgi:hypothetical protein
MQQNSYNAESMVKYTKYNLKIVNLREITY